jgi:hypothetical protein
MKKFLFICLISLSVAAVWLGSRFSENPPGIIPLPYKINSPEKIETTAPILIMGDRMAQHLSLFNVSLSTAISESLVEPIKIQSLGKATFALHRSLYQLDQLEKAPALIIYQGGSEENQENLFDPKEIKNIRHNFDLFQDPQWMTLMYLYTWTARLIYTPVKTQILPDEPKAKELPEEIQLETMGMLYELYEQHLLLFVKKAQDKGSKVILLTTPINYQIPPKKVCASADSPEIQMAIREIRDAIKEQDMKTAYNLALSLSEASVAHAEVFYLYGQVAHRMGEQYLSLKALQKAAAFDCQLWRSNEVFNEIIRKVSRETKTSLFDFAQMVTDQQNQAEDSIFFDEIFPQNLIYERASEMLALQVKKLLQIP